MISFFEEGRHAGRSPTLVGILATMLVSLVVEIPMPRVVEAAGAPSSRGAQKGKFSGPGQGGHPGPIGHPIGPISHPNPSVRSNVKEMRGFYREMGLKEAQRKVMGAGYNELMAGLFDPPKSIPHEYDYIFK